MSQSTGSPRYQNECPHCTYLGQHDDCDLYYCLVQGYVNVKARYGNGFDEVVSGIGIGALYPELAAAERLARARGFKLQAVIR